MLRLFFFVFILFTSLPCLAAQALSKPNKIQNVNVALVLGGGGARALAQAGVMDVLEENNIPIDLIVGSSAGSIIGALYADNPSSHNLRRKVLPLRKWDLLDVDWSAGVRMFWNITGPVQGTALREFIDNNIKAKSFSELKIPLVVVTTDVNKGETFAIQSGPLGPALHASSAIPMLFAPVELYGRLLVDGGVSSPVPVEIAKQYSPKITIAVDIGTTPNNGDVSSVAHLGYRSLHISYYQLSYWQTKQADIVIHPEIDKYSMFTDNNNEEMYRAGREAALKALPDILALLHNKKA
ncbi:MAG: patatin-like phospholipase family protein [Proteobacteria bacterium]|nr:patatin-like phospholipase family protein [Pseudomonadota bacterium]